MKYLVLILFAIGMPVMFAVEVETVEQVDLFRYTGTWYEVGKTPNPFQRSCVSNTTAEYQFIDGRISVINRCMSKKGKMKSVEGVAKVMNDSNSKLKVSFVKVFGKQIFWGDYWILGLAEDYSWALVGEPGQRYAWILSRSPEMNQETYKNVIAIAVANGYRSDAFVLTPQN